MAIDLREALNAISDVVVNRPPALREFDQIYMKAADMLLQVEHLSKWLDGKRTIFIGDGDAIGLSLMHLKAKGILSQGPQSVVVLDFDERVVNSIDSFSRKYDLFPSISAELYNVADRLPKIHWEKYDAFYTNPPFGGSNVGNSVGAFIRRGIEATSEDSTACIVAADYAKLKWPKIVLQKIQKTLMDKGYIIVEMLPEFHHYHLDDNPELTSCSLVARRLGYKPSKYSSVDLDNEELKNFYGDESPLVVRYVRDKRLGGRLPSRDHSMEPFKNA